MRTHRLYGFFLALFAFVGATTLALGLSEQIATAATTTNHHHPLAAPALAHGKAGTALFHRTRRAGHGQASLVGAAGGAVPSGPSGSSGWAQLPSDAANSAGPATGVAQRALTDTTDNNPAVAMQNLRAMIALQRTQQFNSFVATYKLQQYAAAVAAQQAAARALQAAAAAAAAAAAPAAAPPAPPAPSPGSGGGSPGVWAALRQCESGGNYGDDTGNGYYGAYQFALSTWQSLGYGGLPSQAAPAVQDQAAQRLQARSGWGQWPACAAKLGLI